MALLTREQILGAQDLPFEEVDVSEWGGTVGVQGLTGKERDAFEVSLTDRKGRAGKSEVTMKLDNVRAKLVSRCIVDGPGGQRVFSQSDVKALGDKSAAALQAVFEVAQRLSGLTDDDVEELSKNSESDQSDASSSD